MGPRPETRELPLLEVLLITSQAPHGWTAQQGTVGIEARSVAGAVPGLFCGIPVNDAAQVRADSGAFVTCAVLITVDRHFPEASPDYAA